VRNGKGVKEKSIMRAQVTCFQNLHIATTVTKNWVHTTGDRMAAHQR
jgi:hypothetical protein